MLTASSQFRNFLTSQQSEGTGDKKALFINCENTFRDFVFERNDGPPEGEFEPRVTSGRVAALPGSDEELPGTSDLYLRLDMTSCLDGEGIRQATHGR